MHQADGAAVNPGAALEIDALNERAGTVADSDYGDANFSHGKKEILPVALGSGQDAI